MEFKYPANIAYVIFALITVALFVLAYGKKEKIIKLLRFDYTLRFKALKSALLGIGLGLAVFALLGPQVFTGYAAPLKTGLDIYVLMDTSKSMLVADIKPDRMTVAKKIMGDILDNLEGDRIGFIPFASSAYIQMPLTDDYQLAHMFLNVMDTDMISGGGTNLAAALRLANDSFKRASGADRVIIILSDGEEHESSSVEALKSITDERVKIYAVGIGSEKGGLVPIYNAAGDTVTDYMKDADGNPITSRLNAATLSKLAQEGNGAYYQATVQGNETAALLGELAALEKDITTAESIKKFKPLYQYFLGPGLLLILLALFLPEGWKAI